MIKSNKAITLIALLILFVLLFITFYLNPTILKISNISENKEKLPEGLYDSSFEIIDNDDEKFYIVILFESLNNNRIKQIEYNELDEEKNTIFCVNKEKIAIDYVVPIEDINTKFFKFKITFEDGTEIQSTLGTPKWTEKKIEYSGKEKLLPLWPGTYKIECYGARGGNGNGFSLGGYDTYNGVENGGSGGGATDIRLTSNIEDRIMVAGGGGRSRRMV